MNLLAHPAGHRIAAESVDIPTRVLRRPGCLRARHRERRSGLPGDAAGVPAAAHSRRRGRPQYPHRKAGGGRRRPACAWRLIPRPIAINCRSWPAPSALSDRLPRIDARIHGGELRRHHIDARLLERRHALVPRACTDDLTSNGNCATGITSPGCAATTSSSSTFTTRRRQPTLQNSHPTRKTGLGPAGPHGAALRPHLRSLRVDYEYPNGVRVMSMCRQMPQGCENNGGSHRRQYGACKAQGYRITGYKRLELPRRAGQQSLPGRARGPDQQHPRRPADQ